MVRFGSEARPAPLAPTCSPEPPVSRRSRRRLRECSAPSLAAPTAANAAEIFPSRRTASTHANTMAVSTTSTTAATAPAVPTPALGPPHAPSRLGVPAGSSPPPFTLTSSRVTSSPPRVSPPLNLNGTSTCHLRSSLSPHPPSPPRVSSRGGPCITREVRSDEFREHTRPVRFMEETFACPIPLTCPTRSRGCGIDSRRGLIPLPAPKGRALLRCRGQLFFDKSFITSCRPSQRPSTLKENFRT